jgi:hypothetical protein
MSDNLQTPLDRLERSREQLRLSLQAAPARAPSPEGRAAAPNWLETLKSNPGARIVIDVVSQWWDKHPLRLAAGVASAATTASLKPLAQRHPWGLVAGAAAVGMVIAACRPWRWRWARPTLLAGLMPQLLLAAVRAAQVPAPAPAQPHPQAEPPARS